VEWALAALNLVRVAGGRRCSVVGVGGEEKRGGSYSVDEISGQTPSIIVTEYEHVINSWGEVA